MLAGRRSVTSLAAACWLCLAMLAHGQGAAPTSAAPPDIAGVLEAATNLPQILAQSGGQQDETALREAVETERLRLVGILKNDGYLTAEIVLDWPDPAAGASTMQVRVNPGPRYVLGAIDVTTTDPLAPEVMDDVLATAATSVGDDASAAALNSVSGRLIWALGSHGYPFARTVAMDLAPQPGQETATVAFRVEPGTPARFVAADFARVDPALQNRIAPLVPFVAGDLYSVDKLALLRQQMAGLVGIDGARADVVPEGSTGFRLALRAKRTHELLPNTLQSNLGFGFLIASLGALAARQVAVSAGAGRPAMRLLSVLTGGLLIFGGGLLALRIFSLI